MRAASPVEGERFLRSHALNGESIGPGPPETDQACPPSATTSRGWRTGRRIGTGDLRGIPVVHPDSRRCANPAVKPISGSPTSSDSTRRGRHLRGPKRHRRARLTVLPFVRELPARAPAAPWPTQPAVRAEAGGPPIRCAGQDGENRFAGLPRGTRRSLPTTCPRCATASASCGAVNACG
jgi:hypothetical protein